MSFMISSLIGTYARRMNKQLLAHKAPIMKRIVRNLEVYEHIAFSLLKTVNISTPPFGVATTAEEAFKIAKDLDSKDLVLKAQVLTGGRGIGKFKDTDVHGVVMCETPEQVKELARSMIGNILITKQTGPAGKICNTVMVTTRMFPRKEYYMAVMLEQAFNGPVVIISKQGGVNIEDIAAKHPEAINYIPVDIRKGITGEQADDAAVKLGLEGEAKKIASTVVCSLYKLFIEKEALLLEINPFAESLCGEYFTLDCKCSFDDSAEFRQEELFKFRDLTQMDPKEVHAEKYNLNYIALDGNIGCMVNGAGLAMATMDLIKLYGGLPANFLDVGGTAPIEAVKEGFKILSKDIHVQAILVNIFGGIMRCDIIAQGVIEAFKELKLDLPVIVRLQGTNVELANKMILDAKLKVLSVEGFAEAAEASVKIALMMNLAHSLNLEVTYKAKT